MSTVNLQLGQSSSTRQQHLVQQPWLSQYQQPQFQQSQPKFRLGSEAQTGFSQYQAY